MASLGIRGTTHAPHALKTARRPCAVRTTCSSTKPQRQRGEARTAFCPKTLRSKNGTASGFRGGGGTLTFTIYCGGAQRSPDVKTKATTPNSTQQLALNKRRKRAKTTPLFSEFFVFPPLFCLSAHMHTIRNFARHPFVKRRNRGTSSVRERSFKIATHTEKQLATTRIPTVERSQGSLLKTTCF